MEIREWLDQSLSHLSRFTEDKELRRELYTHYEDHRDALMERGVPEEEAETQAVAALGEPAETGLLLRRVHRPYLTWMLIGFRVLVVLALVIFWLNAETLLDWISAQKQQRENMAPFRDVEQMGADLMVGAWRKGSCEARGELLGYEVRVESAGCCVAMEGSFPPLSSGSSNSIAYVLLRFRTLPWQEPDEEALARQLWLEDSLGRVYRVAEQSSPAALPRPVGLLDRESKANLWRIGKGLTACRYLLWIPGYRGNGYSGAERLEVHLGAGDEAGVLPVEFGPRKLKGFGPCASLPEEAAELFRREAYFQHTEEIWRRTGRGAPAEAGGLRAAVPLAESVLAYGTDYSFPPETETLPRGRWAEWPEALLWKDGAQIIFPQTQLKLVLTLRGEGERLPLTEGELFSRLSLTDAAGKRYPLEPGAAWLEEARYYADCALYRIVLNIDGPSDSYALECALEDATIPLRIVMDPESADQG